MIDPLYTQSFTADCLLDTGNVTCQTGALVAMLGMCGLVECKALEGQHFVTAGVQPIPTLCLCLYKAVCCRLVCTRQTCFVGMAGQATGGDVRHNRSGVIRPELAAQERDAWCWLVGNQTGFAY